MAASAEAKFRDVALLISRSFFSFTFDFLAWKYLTFCILNVYVGFKDLKDKHQK